MILRGGTDAVLWRREFPPPTVHISTHTASTVLRKVSDLDPVECLVLGTSDEELADIISISADIHLGGLQVDYRGRESQSIGPSLEALKTLLIDGGGGERIIQVSVTEKTSTTSLRFVTNYGRHMSVGNSRLFSDQPDKCVERVLKCGYSALCGLYGYWTRGEHYQKLRSISTIESNNSLSAKSPSRKLWRSSWEDLPPSLQDSHGLLWEPSPPPAWLKEDGPIWGACEVSANASQLGTTGKVLSPGCFVSWLDCSRALSEVRVTVVHGVEGISQSPICAITFRQGNGLEASVGPSKFSLGETHGSGSKIFCQGDGEEASHHYHHQSWKVGGKRLTGVRIWRSDTMMLSAIQLVAEGQTESPIWSSWGFDTTKSDAIELGFVGGGGGQGKAIGLKVFCQNHQKEGSQNDIAIMAIQALTDAT